MPSIKVFIDHLASVVAVDFIYVTCHQFYCTFSPVLWDIMRCWEKLNPAKRRHDTDPGSVILNKEPEIQVSFETAPGANPDSRKKKLLRFQVNPTANWGPKARSVVL